MYRFKSAREAKALTQDQVAEKLQISRAAYTNIENGKRDPDTGTLITLSKLYECSIDYLLGLEEAEKTPVFMDGLKDTVIHLVEGLSREDFQRLQDFADGLRAARK